jgi:hypothetical protein
VDQAAIRAIQAMLAPVVLMTTAAILAGGIQTMYAAVNDRMRAMTAEKISHLTGTSGGLSMEATLPGAVSERVGETDAQLPLLLRRHRMLQNALLAVYLAVLIVVLAMVLIAVSITVPTAAVGDVALALLLASTIALLLGLIYVAQVSTPLGQCHRLRSPRRASPRLLGQPRSPGPQLHTVLPTCLERPGSCGSR